jgi:CBS domain-containing protein
MARVSDILAQKGVGVMTIDADATVLDAAQRMNDQKVGALVVIEQDQVAGIFTERDVMQRVVAGQLPPAETRVNEVMTREIVCGEPAMSLEEARSIFMNRRIRHLPIINPDGTLEGLISLGDINAWQLDGQEVTIQYLHQYLYGVM